MTDLEKGWVAGIVDGEGSICIVKARKSYRLTLAVQMCHKETIYRLKHLLGHGSISFHKSTNPKGNDSWSWHVASEEAGLILRKLLSALFVKRTQALLAIEYCEKCLHDRRVGVFVPPETEMLRSILAEEIGELNKRGK